MKCPLCGRRMFEEKIMIRFDSEGWMRFHIYNPKLLNCMHKVRDYGIKDGYSEKYPNVSLLLSCGKCGLAFASDGRIRKRGSYDHI